jgi:hypothetical protein
MGSDLVYHRLDAMTFFELTLPAAGPMTLEARPAHQQLPLL